MKDLVKDRKVYRLSLNKAELDLLIDVKETYGARNLNDALHQIIGALNKDRRTLDELLDS